MKILSTSTEDQTIKVIPREYVTSATLKITDDTTNTEVEYVVSPTTNRNYLEIVNSYSLKEGRFYNLVLEKDNGDIIYKDKVFCTAQSVDQASNDYYTVNKDRFTSDTSFDNDFIVL
jgi:hypothetical protein